VPAICFGLRVTSTVRLDSTIGNLTVRTAQSRTQCVSQMTRSSQSMGFLPIAPALLPPELLTGRTRFRRNSPPANSCHFRTASAALSIAMRDIARGSGPFRPSKHSLQYKPLISISTAAHDRCPQSSVPENGGPSLRPSQPRHARSARTPARGSPRSALFPASLEASLRARSEGRNHSP
jgi:hypothetical protein